MSGLLKRTKVWLQWKPDLALLNRQLLHAARTDIQRREERVQKAEARLPANVDDVAAQMTGGLGVQQASHVLDDADESNADVLELQCEVANFFRSQDSDSTSRGAKRLRQNEDEG